MDLVRHLRYFLVVAEESHVGHAADRLGIAQPALSQRIRRLEDELGARLFDRTSRGVSLTEAGRIVREEAQGLLDRFDRVRERAVRAHRGEIGRLRVGVPPQVPGRVLAAALVAFGRRRPEVRLELTEAAPAEQVRRLGERALDAGLVPQPAETPGLAVGATVDVPLGVVLPRGSALADRAEVALAALAGNGLVLAPRAAAPGLYDATLAECRRQGFRPVRVHHAADPELALALVLAGEAVGFDSGAIARKEARAVWRPLAPPGLSWRLSVVWPAEDPHGAVEPLAEALAGALAAEGGGAVPGVETPGAPLADGRQGPWAVLNYRVAPGLGD